MVVFEVAFDYIRLWWYNRTVHVGCQSTGGYSSVTTVSWTLYQTSPPNPVHPVFTLISNPLIHFLKWWRLRSPFTSLYSALCMGCFKSLSKFISLSFMVQLSLFTIFLLHYNTCTTGSFNSKGVPGMMPLSALTACLSIAQASDILQIAPYQCVETSSSIKPGLWYLRTPGQNQSKVVRLAKRTRRHFLRHRKE